MKLTLAAAILALGGCSAPIGRESKAELKHPDRSEKMSEVAIGRFRVSIPAQMKVASRRQSIYGVAIRTAPVGEIPITTQWNDLRSKHGPAGREITFPDEARGISYAPNPAMPMNLVLEAVRPMGDHALWISRPVTAGKEDAAERLAAKILSVYGPGTTHGFCAELGSIRMEGSLSETTALSLAHTQSPAIKVEMETKTVTAPDTSTFTSLDEERKVMNAVGGTLVVRSERERIVAGMTGKEFRIAIAAPGEPPIVRNTWQFSGEPRNPARPHINFVGTAGTQAQSDLDAAWDAVLNSLTPIPMEASR